MQDVRIYFLGRLVSKMEIRNATLADYEDAMRIRKECLGSNEYALYERNIGEQNIFNLVASIDGQVVGFISVLEVSFEPKGRAVWQRLFPYIGFVGVLEIFRRRGVCSELLEVTKQRFRENNFRGSIFLECSSELREIYEKSGFVVLHPDVVERMIGLRPKGCVMSCPLI